MAKIQSSKSIEKIAKRLKNKGKRIVFTNGCFDIIHPGHIKILNVAKKKGDVLIVGLNSDESVRRIKGKSRPILNAISRAQVLAALAVVDYVVIFGEDTPEKLIKLIRPDYLVKGGDWQLDKIVGRQYVKKVCRVKLYPGHSTSLIIKKIVQHNSL
ncbi:MAG: D-glycero-beta-D-manno-heptose 1-phosphate adenylyltransferase [Candidatus Omnitrophica bacterium]|nr:D-glycero-beta-D-manno-heptose 1-phosphate adenylyltransferase [Candidatus Omnitrophota bacterium]